MSSISIHNWKQTDIEGDAFEWIRPIYHPTYWDVPKWWYRGDRTVYTSCVRIDVNDVTSVYIDGTTPLMQITIKWDDDNAIYFEDVRDIRRILILAKDNYGPVIRDESDEYIDVEMLQGNLYVIRWDNYFGPDVLEPLQADDKPVWVNGDNSFPYYSDPIPFITGTYIGGTEPVTYEYRHKEQEEGKNWVTPTDFFPQTNTPTEKTIQLNGKSKAARIHIETKATDADGNVVYNNGPYLELNNPVPVITELPVASSFNQYYIGAQVVGFAGAFTGGTPEAKARARWQWRADPSDNFTGDAWAQNVTDLQEVISSPIPDGMTQIRFQYQVVETDANTGDGPRNTNKTVGPFTVSEFVPPLVGNGQAVLSGTFQVGETIYVDSIPVFTGGKSPVVYEYQFQKSEAASGSPWSGFEGPWEEYNPVTRNVPSLVLTGVTENQYIRLQVRATDADGVRVIQSGFVYGPVLPPPPTSWGAVILYVNDIEYNTFVGAPMTVLMNDPIDVKVEWEGDATGTTLWSQRFGGSAVFDDATSANPKVTMTAAGQTVITVTLNDPSGRVDPRSESINFWAVDAF